MKYWEWELSCLSGNLRLSLKGNWLPKLVPSTDQANINMNGNRAVFLWSPVPGEYCSLGKILSLQWALAWDPEASHGRGCLGPPLWVDSPPQVPRGPPPGSPSRSMGTRRQTLSQDCGSCEQGISNGQNTRFSLPPSRKQSQFLGTTLKTMAFCSSPFCE